LTLLVRRQEGHPVCKYIVPVPDLVCSDLWKIGPLKTESSCKIIEIIGCIHVKFVETLSYSATTGMRTFSGSLSDFFAVYLFFVFH